MVRKTIHISLSAASLADLDFIGLHYGDLDRTNAIRVLIAEKKQALLDAEKRRQDGRVS